MKKESITEGILLFAMTASFLGYLYSHNTYLAINTALFVLMNISNELAWSRRNAEEERRNREVDKIEVDE